MDMDVVVLSCNRWVREMGKKDSRGGNDQGFVAGFGCQESSGPSSVGGFGNWCLRSHHSSKIPAPQCRASLSQVLPEMTV